MKLWLNYSLKMDLLDQAEHSYSKCGRSVTHVINCYWKKHLYTTL